MTHRLAVTGLLLVRHLLGPLRRVQRYLQRAELSTHCTFEQSTVLHLNDLRVDNPGEASRIRIGKHTHVLGFLKVFQTGGTIRIGDGCYIGERSMIFSMSSVIIGDRVIIAHNVTILDSALHSLSAKGRSAQIDSVITPDEESSLRDIPAQPVIIENDAWIACNVTILKGVRIGRGAIVGANSVVASDVPDFCIAAGNPARVVSQSLP